MKRTERFRCYYVSVSGSHQPQASLAKNLDKGKAILPDSAHSSDGLSDSDNDSDDDDPDTAQLKTAIDASKKSNVVLLRNSMKILLITMLMLSILDRHNGIINGDLQILLSHLLLACNIFIVPMMKFKLLI